MTLSSVPEPVTPAAREAFAPVGSPDAELHLNTVDASVYGHLWAPASLAEYTAIIQQQGALKRVWLIVAGRDDRANSAALADSCDTAKRRLRQRFNHDGHAASLQSEMGALQLPVPLHAGRSLAHIALELQSSDVDRGRQAGSDPSFPKI
jgi:hypothetical protein